MISKRIGKTNYALYRGRIIYDSYMESIKKLSLSSKGVFAQLLPARIIAGENHLFACLEHSISAFKSGSNFTKKPELELIARLLAKKQLNSALEIAEFENEDMVFITSAEKKDAKQLMKKLNFSEKECSLGKNKAELMKLFGISETELKTVNDLENPLEELIIERCALIALER